MAPEFVDIDNQRYVCNIVPQQCPLCHFFSIPIEIAHSVIEYGGFDDPSLEVIYKCPRSECSHLFIARYETRSERPGMYRFRTFVLKETLPRSPQRPQIPAEVAKVSEVFIRIYQQAMAAEAYGLDQIAGVGYRKALEFLIKDYCISTHPDAEKQIKAVQLSTCIANYVDGPQIKVCAERAAWLGNDETHYERKWADKDISDLKALITLTVNWIHNNLLTERYKSEMPK